MRAETGTRTPYWRLSYFPESTFQHQPQKLHFLSIPTARRKLNIMNPHSLSFLLKASSIVTLQPVFRIQSLENKNIPSEPKTAKVEKIRVEEDQLLLDKKNGVNPSKSKLHFSNPTPTEKRRVRKGLRSNLEGNGHPSYRFDEKENSS